MTNNCDKEKELQNLKAVIYNSSNFLLDATVLSECNTPTTCNASIIFSAIAVEAFISDMQLRLSLRGSIDEINKNETFKVLRDLLCQLEEERVQIRTKIQLMYYILTGNSIKKGMSPYQNFDLLIDLRNCLIHSKASLSSIDPDGYWKQDENKHHQLINRLVDAGAGDEDFLKCPDWKAITYNQPCAKWAVKSASAIIKHLVDVIPSESMQKALLRHFQQNQKKPFPLA